MIFHNASTLFFMMQYLLHLLSRNSDVVLKKDGLFTGTGETVLIGCHENSK